MTKINLQARQVHTEDNKSHIVWQVTVPSWVPDHLGWKKGMVLEAFVSEGQLRFKKYEKE